MDLIERVNKIVEDVVSSVVMPSFRSLRPEDNHSKDTPGDPDGRARASWMAVPAAQPSGYTVFAERGGGGKKDFVIYYRPALANTILRWLA